jgi:hypothetical protein
LISFTTSCCRNADGHASGHLVAGIGLAARVTDFGTADERQEATVIKAGKSVTASGETRTIR